MNSDHQCGKVYLVGAGPGDPGLLTLKGCEVLKSCEVVIYDALVNPALVEYVPPEAERIFIGHSRHHDRITQAEVHRLMIERARHGKVVVRLKGGDPFIFGRGGEEALALAEAGIEWEVVPGVSAGHAVPAYAGIPLTHRAYASSVAFVTGHECDGKRSPVAWDKLATAVDTLVVFMGAKNLPRLVAALLEAGRAPSTPVAVIEQGTHPDQRVRVATLETVLDAVAEPPIGTPTLIVVGEVVSLSVQRSAFSLQPQANLVEMNNMASLVGDAPLLRLESQRKLAERLMAER